MYTETNSWSDKISKWIEDHRQFSTKELENFILEVSELNVTEAKILQKTILIKFFNKCLPSISHVELFVTEKCNLRCDYCFIHGKNDLNRMNFNVAKRAVDLFLPECNGAREFNVVFIGGEPLLEFDLVKEVVNYTSQKAKQFDIKLTYDMTTNGMLLNHKKLSFFEEHNVNLLLSLDGLPFCHNSHRKTISGEESFWKTAKKIPLIKEYQPWLGARVTPMPDTIRYLNKGIRYLHALGINQFLIGLAEGGIYWEEEELNEYEKQMIMIAQYLLKQKKLRNPMRITLFEKDESRISKYSGMWGCCAGRNSLTVESSGKIFPCTKLLGQNDLKGAYQLGSVQKGITYLERRKRLTSFIPTKRDKCEVCDIKDECSGGCYAVNYEATGSIYNPCPTQCKIHRKTLEIQKKGLEILGEYA